MYFPAFMRFYSYPGSVWLSGCTTPSGVLQPVEHSELELDIPVQGHLPWFRLADCEVRVWLSRTLLLTVAGTASGH